MADINGTNGNDTIQPFGSSLLLTLSATPAQGSWPLVNVLINGVMVLSNVSITANHILGASQVISAQIPGGVAVTSISIQYSNDAQTSYEEDRNLYVSSVKLNGTELPVSAATYLRTGISTIQGQEAMLWGGSLEFSGAVVANVPPPVGGNVSIDALAGIDTVLFSGTRSEYSVSATPTGHTVTKLSGGESAALANVERLDFSDINLALDMNGNAGTTAKLIAALFGESYLAVEEYVGIGISLLDGGMSATDLAGLAAQTALFVELAGSTSNTAFVQLVYTNVVGFGPSQEQLDFYVGLLDSGAHTKASLGLLAAQTSVNEANVVGVMQSGIEYI